MTTSDPGEIRAHDHVAWCGDGSADLHRVAASAFAGADRRGEQMILIAEAPRAGLLTGLADRDGLLARGALNLLRPEDIYLQLTAEDQRGRFEATLDQALTGGYTGLCVVADTTSFASGSEESFEWWLRWEATADDLESTRPISGVCFLDRARVPVDRLAVLAALHPVHGPELGESGFRVFRDGDRLRAVGELDVFGADRVRRAIEAAVAANPVVLDFSGVEFIDCASLRMLDDIARSGPPIRVTGARRIVHRAWDLLDLPAPALEFGR